MMKQTTRIERLGGPILDWTLRIVAAAILTQTLYFKFTAAPESVYIFTTLGLEPWGRIGSGVAELVASILLIVPGTVVFGAVLALGIISGAIMSHLTQLGIEVQGDGGLLFGLALVVFTCALVLVARRRAELPFIGGRLGEIGGRAR
jgi:putative oxidoreductase